MELPISTSLFERVSRASSLCPHPQPSKHSCVGYKFGRPDIPRRRRFKFKSKLPPRVEFSLNNKASPLNSSVGNAWEEDSEFVEVIGIGSRKDAVLDFCLSSPSLSPNLRFWNILFKESMKVQLQQRLTGEDAAPRFVEAPLALQSCPKAVILVAGAAYGSDYMAVLDILDTVKSANGIVVSIILKPFSFEGRRRHDEVKDLVDKLQELTTLCIVIDADSLLEKKDLLTLDEALKTANNAVLMAMNAISILISELQIKILDVPHDCMKELEVPELKEILGSYKEAKIGFGNGYNVETSIMRAICDCPFLGSSVKELNGIVVLIFASSAIIESSDVHAMLHTFRRATECKGEIIASVVHEPNLHPNQIATTVLTLGSVISYIEKEPSEEGGIFSRLAQHFPFIVNILRKPTLQSGNSEDYSPHESPCPQLITSTGFGEELNTVPMNGTKEGFDSYSSELQSILSNSTDEITSSRNYASTEESEVEFPEAASDSLTSYNQNSKGPPTLQREPLIGHNIGSGYQFAQEWANKDNKSGPAPMLDNMTIYKLPVGVKPSGDAKGVPNSSNTTHQPEKINDGDMNAEAQFSLSMSWDAFTDASSEALTEFYANTYAGANGDHPGVSKNHGALSARAASMLEAERDSQKKWSPVMEINYRGGTYMGRCQGGLPEGKGRLSLGDGSIYDGMWRYGKRSGFGSFRFSNGDMFRGSWRDDVMHGKGWFYFRTGDRWFVNFWKGKANGEGRFYSKSGDIFFGNFKNGWRDGHFLRINVDGSRYLEIWEEGVLVSREQLENDAGAG